MRLTSSLTPRQFLIIAHDLAATAVAIVLTFVMRFEGPVLAEKLRAHVSEEVARRPAGEPASDNPSIDKPAEAVQAPSAATKSGKRKMVLMGVGMLLALVAAS